MKSGRNLIAVLVCMALVAGLAATAAAFMKNKFEKEVEKEQGAVKLVREVQRGGYDVVTTTEIKKWIDDGRSMVLVDTLPYEKSYKKAHVPTAKQFLFPITDMNTWDTRATAGKSKADFKKLLGADKDIPVVIYCGFVKCTRSHNGAAWAVKLGYTNVYRYSGGIFAWKGAGYEVGVEQ
ncbi:MAG: rhodanese-like domain-containing protein [Desulfobacterales bacterium]|nr:rhodanese-like domain-containing protein [Desulfobacterales bacterium]